MAETVRHARVEAPDAGWGSVQTILLVGGANVVMLLDGTLAVGMPLVLTLYAQQVLGQHRPRRGT